MRAVGYCRVSTDEQARKGVSLDDQERRIREFVSEQDWELVGVFTDDGVSGSIPFADRPAGAQAFTADAEKLVVIDWDRLSRDAADFLAVVRDRDVVSVTQVGEPPLLRDLRAVLAQEEKRKIVERTKAAAVALAHQGRYNGPPVCGYDLEDGELTINPAEAEIVRRIAAEFIAGSTRREITRRLNTDQVRTKRGGRWREATVSNMLGNPVYVGRVRLHDEEYPGKHEPILDEDTWDRVQSLLEASRSRRGKGRGRPPAGNHLFLGGMLRCGSCGEAMVPRTNNGYADYLCNGRMAYGPEFCEQGSVQRKIIDLAVYSYFERIGLDVEATRAQLAESRDRKLAEVRALLGAAEAEARRAEGRLTRVRRDYVDGKLTAKDWGDFRTELEGERAGANAEAERLRTQEREVSTWAEFADAERETLKRLAEIRRAIAGEVNDVAGVEAVRAALSRLFDEFVLHGPFNVPPTEVFAAGGKVYVRRGNDAARPLELPSDFPIDTIPGPDNPIRSAHHGQDGVWFEDEVFSAERLTALVARGLAGPVDGLSPSVYARADQSRTYLIAVGVREEVLEGYSQGLTAVLRQIPLDQAANKERLGTPQQLTT